MKFSEEIKGHSCAIIWIADGDSTSNRTLSSSYRAWNTREINIYVFFPISWNSRLFYSSDTETFKLFHQELFILSLQIKIFSKVRYWCIGNVLSLEIVKPQIVKIDKNGKSFQFNPPSIFSSFSSELILHFIQIINIFWSLWTFHLISNKQFSSKSRWSTQPPPSLLMQNSTTNRQSRQNTKTTLIDTDGRQTLDRKVCRVRNVDNTQMHRREYSWNHWGSTTSGRILFIFNRKIKFPSHLRHRLPSSSALWVHPSLRRRWKNSSICI